jgi:hypothetical protein
MQKADIAVGVSRPAVGLKVNDNGSVNSEGKAVFHHWKPIKDISDRFRDRELEALWRAWTDQRKTLNQTQSLAEFNGRRTLV